MASESWASVDGLGKFDVWNLNVDTEVRAPGFCGDMVNSFFFV